MIGQNDGMWTTQNVKMYALPKINGEPKTDFRTYYYVEKQQSESRGSQSENCANCKTHTRKITGLGQHDFKQKINASTSEMLVLAQRAVIRIYL